MAVKRLLKCANGLNMLRLMTIRATKRRFPHRKRPSSPMLKAVFKVAKGRLLHGRRRPFGLPFVPDWCVCSCKWLADKVLRMERCCVWKMAFRRLKLCCLHAAPLPGASNEISVKSKCHRHAPFPRHSATSVRQPCAAKFFIFHSSLFIKNMYFCSPKRHIRTWK